METAEKSKAGHRERLRQRFLAGEAVALTDEALLELLLCYAIPLKDVQPLARKLVAKFGGMAGVLSADPEALCQVDGIKSHSATLIKLVSEIRGRYAVKREPPPAPTPSEVKPASSPGPAAGLLFDIAAGKPTAAPASKKSKTAKVAPPPTPEPSPKADVLAEKPKAKSRPVVAARRGTELFAKAVLKEAIALLPGVPTTDSLEEIRDSLRARLHYSGEQTRQRCASYILRRMFPSGSVDRPLLVFARAFADTQNLRDVCFYRFLKAEPLQLQVVEELLLPALGVGRLNRQRIRDHLAERFPSARNIKDSAQAIVDALAAGGIAKVDRLRLSFSYRDVPVPALAFVLHSEYPEPGMYDIASLEANRAIRALLWNPARLLPSLYELRNRGLISKISEIDNMRQFTTRWSLDEAVGRLVAGGGTT